VDRYLEAKRRTPAPSRDKPGRLFSQVAQHRPNEVFGHRRRSLPVGMGKAVATGRRGPTEAGQRPRVQLEGITHVVETEAMGQLGIDLAHDMTPRREGARLVLGPRRPGDLRDATLRNDIADLPQNVELGTCWFDWFVFHPCLVAGRHGQANTFFAKTVGWL
jgi:hypothetical protein